MCTALHRNIHECILCANLSSEPPQTKLVQQRQHNRMQTTTHKKPSAAPDNVLLRSNKKTPTVRPSLPIKYQKTKTEQSTSECQYKIAFTPGGFRMVFTAVAIATSSAKVEPTQMRILAARRLCLQSRQGGGRETDSHGPSRHATYMLTGGSHRGQPAMYPPSARFRSPLSMSYTLA